MIDCDDNFFLQITCKVWDEKYVDSSQNCTRQEKFRRHAASCIYRDFEIKNQTFYYYYYITLFTHNMCATWTPYRSHIYQRNCAHQDTCVQLRSTVDQLLVRRVPFVVDLARPGSLVNLRRTYGIPEYSPSEILTVSRDISVVLFSSESCTNTEPWLSSD